MSALTSSLTATVPPSIRKVRAIDVLPIAVLVAMIVYFSVAASGFTSGYNITLMTGQGAILLLAALGVTLVIVMGSIDLSIGSVVLLTGSVIAELLSKSNINVALVLLITIGIGAAAGIFNGLVFSYFRVPSFIVTLGTLSLFSGLALTITGGNTITFSNSGLSSLSIGQWIPHVQNVAIVAVVVLAIVWVIARRTRFGVYVYALGGNERIVSLTGIRVNLHKTLCFTVAGVTAALSGLFATSQLGSAGSTIGSSTLLTAIAAIVVGGTPLSGGAGGVHRTVLGVLIITVLADGLNELGVGQFDQTMIEGAVIVVAAVFTLASKRGVITK
jgi:ribose transport system permease protein